MMGFPFTILGLQILDFLGKYARFDPIGPEISN
jgi:hypothetical protein